jgi:molybdenum cofactor sulfurtransferase
LLHAVAGDHDTDRLLSQIRTENIDLMKKVFWGGGAVAIATSSDNFHVLKCRPSDKLEDGTVPFLDIVSLKHVFDFAESLGGVKTIQAHVHALTRYLFTRLSALKHGNGTPLLEIFGNHGHPSPEEVQGGIVNFEVMDPDGLIVSYRLVEEEAAKAGFHIRTGATPF